MNTRLRWLRTSICLSIAIMAGITPIITQADASTVTGPSPIVISEVQTGGCVPAAQTPCVESSKAEFVELFNQSASVIDITGWQVRYLPAAGSTSKPVNLGSFDGTVSGHGFVLLSYPEYLTEVADLSFTTAYSSGSIAKTGGHIQLVDATGTVADVVGWGSATEALGKAVPAPSPGSSLARIAVSGGVLKDSRDNAADFTVSTAPSPTGGGYTPAPPAPVPTPQPEPTPDPGTPTGPYEPQPGEDKCTGISISEILPDPSGVDTDGEFIELRAAATGTVDISGCSLQTSANSKMYRLADIALAQGSYLQLTAATTGLTLGNSTGGTVYLLAGETEVESVAYPASMPEDSSWAIVDGSWGRTYLPTPGAANTLLATEPCPAGQERNLATNRCVTIDDEATPDANTGATAAPSLTPCKPGQERNAETNRCRNVAGAAASLTACKPGQIRNPDTNRCASAASAKVGGSTAQACKPGQERNPETNRCRNTVTAAAAKTCPAGQERNPETNRCRKINAAAVGATTTKVDDVKAPVSLDSNRWLLAGLAVAGAIAYGVYEWRQEIMLKLRSITGRFGKSQARHA